MIRFKQNRAARVIVAKATDPKLEVVELRGVDDMDNWIWPSRRLSLNYPSILGRPHLSTFFDDAGYLLQLPYNRWGLCGDIIVAKRDTLTDRLIRMSDAEIAGVSQELVDSKGYLDPRLPDYEDHGIRSLYPRGEPSSAWRSIIEFQDA